MSMPDEPGKHAFLKNISTVFSQRIRTFGHTPKGVLWKDNEGQQLRFEILSTILDSETASGSVSINDFGCGYGALFDFLRNLPSLPELTYNGYDISEDMILAAWHRINDRRAIFTQGSTIDTLADYTFVSGTFNLKLNTPTAPWNAYIKSSLIQLWTTTRKGLAFNMLDKDHPEQGDSLYYADAEEFLSFCRNLSDDVSLITDYPLHEWTILIRRSK